MRFERLITLGVARPLLRVFPGSKERALPILMYHGISDDPEPGVHPYYQVNTPPAVFGRQMQLLKDLGYKGVNLEEGMEWLGGQRAEGRRSRTDSRGQKSEISNQESLPPLPTPNRVAITFDDGFQDFLTEAVPVLQRHMFSATVFLPTAFIGDTRRSFAPSLGRSPRAVISPPSSVVRPRPCLTWNEVRDLQRRGVRFGSHTVSHPRLIDLPWADVELEIRDSKAEIEQRLGGSVRTFCHPFAFPQERRDYVARFTGLLQECGYHWATTTRIGHARRTDPPFTLKRLPVNGLDDGALLSAKLAGAYDWLATAQTITRALKARVAGRKAQGAERKTYAKRRLAASVLRHPSS